jgi:hypothetical protein
MKSYLKLFLFFTPFLGACANQNEQVGGEQKEFITDAAPGTDSLAAGTFSIELKADLSDYFSQQVIDELDRFVTSYNSMKTDADFEKMYHDGKNVMTAVYADLDDPKTDYLLKLSGRQEYWSSIEILEELQEFNGKLGPLEISCVAECTELDLVFDLTDMREKSKATAGEGDDDFINLVISIEGDYGFAGYYGFKSWYNQTWDYGGSSLIGNDTLLQCIERYMEYEAAYDLFEPELALIYTDFANALQNNNTFNYSQEIILKEYDAILKLNFFKPEDTEKIKEHYKAIKAGGDPFQFECETGECTYG